MSVDPRPIVPLARPPSRLGILPFRFRINRFRDLRGNLRDLRRLERLLLLGICGRGDPLNGTLL